MDKRQREQMERELRISATLIRIQESINLTVTLEPLLADYFQFLKIIEERIIPTIGENEFYHYLVKLSRKSLEDGRILKMRDLTETSLCQIAFRSTSNIKKYQLKSSPRLLNILGRVIEDVRSEENCTTASVLKLCKKAINRRETLADSLEFYKKNIDWKYLSFVEDIVITEIGEIEFYEYVKDFLVIKLNAGEMKTYSTTEAFRWILEGGNYSKGCLTKSEERYPMLYKVVNKAIEDILHLGTQGKRKLLSAVLREKIEGFNTTSKDAFLSKCQEVIKKEFHEKRRRLNKIELYRILFQEEITRSHFKHDLFNKNFLHNEGLNALIAKEILFQRTLINDWNKKGMEKRDLFWTIYFIKGTSIHSIKIDFKLIHSKQLQNELKMFLSDNFNPDNSHKTYDEFKNIIRFLNILQKEFQINKVSDVKKYHVSYLIQYCKHNPSFSATSIKRSKSSFSKLAEYLIDKRGYKYSPTDNIFKAITLRRVDDFSKKTEFIPEEVIQQIDLYKNELNDYYRLMYEIFSNTGLRPKEVIEIEINCCQVEDVSEGYARLDYIPFKIKSARRKRGLSDHVSVYVPLSLYESIKKHQEAHQELYKEFNLNYLFARRTNHGVFIPKSRDFCLAINKLIKKHNICDNEGNVWHFTAKQIRKTIAVNLVEDNATPQEVATQLGHLSYQTTEKYYIEVKKTKLAQMNSEFFKKKFELSIGDENLKLYNEEERRQLYVDFCLNIREVELGTCSKHFSEGACGTRVGASSCATCTKLCTGKKYWDKWNELYQSQIQVIYELQQVYMRNGIEEYHEFVEYKRECTLLERYHVVLEQISKE